jgi:uncharacterized protein
MGIDITFLIMLAAAFIAGSINAVAGGGTLFSFSALGLALPLRLANATNAALLTPSAISASIVFLKELRRLWRRFVLLMLPTVLGAYLGAIVLVNTSDALFRRVVPFLILFAVMLFALKDPLTRWVRQLRGRGQREAAHNAGAISLPGWIWGLGFQFVIAFYGGYFGAGIGILMISSFSLMGMDDMHEMNGLKNPLAALMNGIAAARFIGDGLVHWEYALPMAVCAMTGGFLAARVSKRINQKYLRGFVIVYGVIIAAYMFGRYWFGLFQ